MKNILTLITMTLLLGCTSVTNASNNDLVLLEKRYNNTKTVIYAECSLDAGYVAKIARQRDAGVSREGVTEWVLKSAEREQKNPTLKPPLTTADVLYQVTLVIWVYNNKHLTSKEIYKKQFNHCTAESMEFLDFAYGAAKKILKEQNGK